MIWQIRGLVKRFRGGVAALDGVDLDVAPGERVALVGASGSGKTTLCLGGLGWLPVDGGDARVAGHDVRRRPAPPESVQLLFQHPRSMLHPARSIGSLLLESARRFGRGPGAVDAILGRVGLAGRGGALPSELSGGEQRRAGIARILLANPSLIVADEPTSGLDAALAADVVELLFAPGRATVVVTHDLHLALATCERVVVLDEGRVVEQIAAGSPPTSDVARRLFGAARVGATC